MSKSIRLAERDSKGRFIKGSCANPKGNNQFTSIVPLIEALQKEGKKRDEDFWDMVAQRVWQNDTVLIAVLKKILPDKIKDETPPATINVFMQNIYKKAGLINDTTGIDGSEYSGIKSRLN